MAMPTAAPGAANGSHTAGTARGVGGVPRSGRGGGRRRQLPLAVLGVLLVLGCALGFAVASTRADRGEQVLVLARPVRAGEVVTGADLRQVRVSAGAGLAVVPAGSEASVVGRPAALDLAAGELLPPAAVGQPSAATAGMDVVAVGLKPGGFPPGLAAGDRVAVVAVPGSVSSAAGGGSGTGASGAPVTGVVVSVQAGQASAAAPTVFSLQIPSSAAGGVAVLAAAGEVALVQLGGGS